MAGMRIRRGVHLPLEEAADQIIKESLANTTRHADKADILTPWKLRDRLSREVYVASGTPEAHLRRGHFGRVYNPRYPHLNSQDGTGTGGRKARHNVDLEASSAADYSSTLRLSWSDE
jgi:hypothetical protein